MKRPLDLLLPNGTITREFPAVQGRYPVAYAATKQLSFAGAIVIQRHYETYSCFMELLEFNADALEIGFAVNRPSFFIFFMLEGSVRFEGPDGLIIAEPAGCCCYATFNTAAQFTAHFPVGINCLLYIALHPDWLPDLAVELPALKPMIYQFLAGEGIYAVLPQYPVSGRLIRLLKQLQNLKKGQVTELAGKIHWLLARIMVSYHEVLITDRTKRNDLAYKTLEHINEHFREPNLSNGAIAVRFYTTIKTQIRGFKTEFGLTPNAYIIHLRMRLAHDLLSQRLATTADVYSLVGYQDAHSFRVQFSKYFGYSPGALHRGP